MMKSIRSLTGWLFIFTTVALPLGCGKEKVGKVSDKVTFKEKAMSGGAVIFANEDNTKIERVPIQSDGTYSSSNVPFGKLGVGVEPPSKGLAASLPKGAKAPKMQQDGKTVDVYSQKGGEYVDIPPQLRMPATSKITIDVDGPEKVFPIPLKGTK